MAIALQRHRGVLTAVIDDGKANALTFDTIAGLRSAVSTSVAENMPLIIAGRDGFFSAGFDLEVMRSGDRDLVTSLAGGGFLLFREMLSAPVPILAAGALLLLAADYRIGQPGTYQVGLNETRIGVALPEAAVALARYRLSTNHLAAATLVGTVVTPDLACDFGYLDRLDSDPSMAALATATELASVGLRAFAKTKQRMNAGIVDLVSLG